MAYRKKAKPGPESSPIEPGRGRPWWMHPTSIVVEALIVVVVIGVVAALDYRQDHRPQMPDATPVPVFDPTPDSASTGEAVSEPTADIPGALFMMGCVPGDGQCKAQERPRRTIQVAPFAMDVHEVTVAAYRDCVRSGACGEPATSGNDETQEYFNWGKADREDHPINGVSWFEADIYCRMRGKRLPTEAEFEYALRLANPGDVWPWGSSSTPPAGFGNYADETAKSKYEKWEIFEGYDDGYVGTAPVCVFGKSPHGLCDVSGNVFEWTADWFSENTYARPPVENPKGVTAGAEKVLRGGAWDSYPRNIRSSDRHKNPPVFRGNSVGFRCVTTATTDGAPVLR